GPGRAARPRPGRQPSGAGIRRPAPAAAGLAGRSAPGRAAPGAAGAQRCLLPLPRDRLMTFTLLRKLLRDVRLPLAAVGLLLCGFQCLWAKVTERILGRLSPFFNSLAGLAGLTNKDIEEMLFEGPGKIIRTIIGGEQMALDSAMNLLSIGYVHPLMQTIFCV